MRPLKIAYVARNDGSDTRVSKECNSLANAGHDVLFIGWDAGKSPDRPDPMPGVAKQLLHSAYSESPLSKIAGFPRFIMHVAREIHYQRPDVVHTVNEELGLIAVLLQRIYGFSTVCDIFDSIELKWGRKPFPANALTNLVTSIVREQSNVLLVTDDARKARLGIHSSNARTVHNYPVDVGADVAFELPDSTGPIRLYVAGTLYAARGIGSILDMLDKRDDFEVISAGWLYDDMAEAFANHPRVDYRGVVTPSDSLHLAARCHAVLALYEPSNENNVMASPNKIYDALCIGRPVIINREARISSWVAKMNVGYVVGYGVADELNAVLDDLNLRRSAMYDVVAELRSVFENGYSWEVAERELIAAYATFT